MADTKNAMHGGYSPDMDGPSHEATYQGFVRFAEIATGVVLCWVLALAIGGIKHAWVSAVFGVILSGIAGASGPCRRRWRAGAGRRRDYVDLDAHSLLSLCEACPYVVDWSRLPFAEGTALYLPIECIFTSEPACSHLKMP